MNDFLSQIQHVESMVKGAAKGVYGMLDQFTFNMLINGLKGNDAQAVIICIDQLVKEKRPLSIPPIYVVAQAHPNDAVKQRAMRALHELDPKGEVEKLTEGKEVKEAVKILVEKYGLYKKP